jgi:hypothetical protein
LSQTCIYGEKAKPPVPLAALLFEQGSFPIGLCILTWIKERESAIRQWDYALRLYRKKAQSFRELGGRLSCGHC